MTLLQILRICLEFLKSSNTEKWSSPDKFTLARLIDQLEVTIMDLEEEEKHGR